MDTSPHTLNTLFAQLGLPNDEEAVWRFIREHHSLTPQLRLEQAEFWNPAQSDSLKEAVEEDSDWSEVVDELDALLRLPAHYVPR